MAQERTTHRSETDDDLPPLPSERAAPRLPDEIPELTEEHPPDLPTDDLPSVADETDPPSVIAGHRTPRPPTGRRGAVDHDHGGSA